MGFTFAATAIPDTNPPPPTAAMMASSSGTCTQLNADEGMQKWRGLQLQQNVRYHVYTVSQARNVHTFLPPVIEGEGAVPGS